MVGWLLLRWVLLAAAIGLVSLLLPGVEVNGGFFSLLWIAALFALLNLTLGTLLRILTLPLLVLTLGLFTLVVNAFVLWLTDLWSGSLTIDGFWWTFLAALCITVVAAILQVLVPEPFRGKSGPAPG